MLDINTITSLVGSLGFPIVMCFILCFGYSKQLKENTKAINELVEMLHEMMFGKDDSSNDN